MSAKDRALLSSLLLLLAVNTGVSDVDGCANGFPDMNLITTRALKTNTGQKLESDLSLLNSFSCNGTLTGLVLGVDVRTETDSRNQYPEISLWRPGESDESEESDDSEDSDEYEYSLVEGSTRTVQLTPANFSTSGVFEYAIVPPLDFQANDILGWTQPEGKKSVVRMYTIDGTEFMINRIILESDSVSANSFSYEDDSESYSDNVLLLYPVVVTEPAASCNDQQFLSEQTVRSLALNISKVKTRDKTQRIFPAMHFTCTGLLTKWIIGGEPDKLKDPFPELQLWRASGESSYNKTGVSLITAVPNGTMYTNVYEYILDTPLEFQEGDIFGLHKPKESESVLNIFLQENSGPFAYGKKKDADMALTEIMVDSTMSLNQNDYPMVSVEISMISSPTSVMSSSIQTTTSSSYFEITSQLSSSTLGVTSITDSINNFASSSETKTTSTVASPTSVLSNSMQTTTTSSYIEMTTTTSSSSTSFLSTITENMNNTTSSSDVKSSSTLGVTSPVQSSNTEAVSSPTAHSEFQIPSADVSGSSNGMFSSAPTIQDVKMTPITQTSSHLMGPTSQTDETTRISPPATADAFPDEQQNGASAVTAIVVVLVVTALVVLLLVAMIIGIVILKVKRSKTFSPAHYSEETVDMNVNGGKTMVRSISLAKPVTKETGFTNPIYEVENGMGVLKNSSSVKQLREVTGITNPIYAVEEVQTSAQKVSSTNTSSAAETPSSFVPEVVYEVAERAVPNSIQNNDSQMENYAVLEYSDLSNFQEYSGQYVPTMAERQRIAQDEQHQDQTQTYSRLERQGFFVESEIYWSPGSEFCSIYQQLAQKKYREISRQQIKTICPLGSGQFGLVSKGLWYSPAGPKEVAIKVLQDKADKVEKVKFLQEAAIMGQFHHPNVITLHGVVTVGEPAMIILELMEKGDLREHLHSFRPAPGEMLSSSEEPILLGFCRQVASGMDYLSKKSFVHRDLAARNILVSSKRHCKIADFGMSRDLMDDDYYKSSGGQIPVKWTAPEALLYKKYSTASDVWSFGVVMYEIWSLGHKPFEDITNQRAYRSINDGYRLPPPPGCPRAIYELMIQCWHPETANRPSFSHLHSVLSHPDNGLLEWSDEDLNSHPQASVLGAPLEAGTHLYPQLQNTYMCMNP